jgi:two-component system cell cycle sensor histidine kinase/response regulator CckA
MVLLGWTLGIESLKRIFPGFVAMNPTTAIGFIVAGASLLFFWRREKSLVPIIIGKSLAGFLVFFGALKLCEYEFGWHWSFDQFLFQNQIQHHTEFYNQKGLPNQVAPNTALNFLMSGLALWLLHSSRHRFSRPAQNISLVLLFVSLVPLLGYAYHASYLYSIGSYIPMALHTAIFFCLLAFGMIIAQCDFGVVAVFTSETPGGAIARRLLPFAFGVPFVVGALAMLGEKGNLYPAELGISIVVVGSFAAFSALIWWNAVSLNRADAQRRNAEEKLRAAYDELEARIAERTINLRQANEALHMQILLQQRAEEKIREQAKLLDEAKDAILVLNLEHRVTFWNKGAERMYGWAAAEVFGKSADDLLFTDGRMEGFEQIFETGAWRGELQQLGRTGQPIIVESSWTLVKENGKPKCILIINTNVTEKKNYEAQFLRSQRMESLGALAGGIAHDLNNALTPVIMGAELLKEKISDDKPRRLLDTILTSAKRGTEMVRQILTFARGTQSRIAPVQTDGLVKEMVKILGDTFAKSIDIQSYLGRDLWPIRGDVTELHQVLLNLCVNARDAMPQGGQLTLAADNVTLKNENMPADAGLAPGPYVMLSVTDTGTGIPPEVLPRIFEPFFTTKSPDKGTGLGLSTVNNIIKHHNGHLQVQSETGKGTRFTIYLPAIQTAETAAAPDTVILPAGNGELIMVVDDEEAVRELTKTTLESYGYRVIAAANGFLGITCFEEFQNEIRVVVSDTDMPFSNGLAAIRSMQQIKPDIRIILASGGQRDTQFFRRIDATHLKELPKPYTVEALLNAVAEAVKSMEPKSRCKSGLTYPLNFASETV